MSVQVKTIVPVYKVAQYDGSNGSEIAALITGGVTTVTVSADTGTLLTLRIQDAVWGGDYTQDANLTDWVLWQVNPSGNSFGGVITNAIRTSGIYAEIV